MKHLLKTTLTACLMLSVFAGYNWCVHAFPHVHVIDGARIVHSHPYNGDPAHPDHQHSGSEVIVFSALSHFLTTEPAQETALPKQEFYILFLFADSCEHVYLFVDTGHYLRAPPSFC